MDNQEKPKQQQKKRGGPRPNSGRPSKAKEFGLANLMLRSWSEEERERNIKHIASLISDDMIEAKFGPMFRVDPKVQVMALELLLKYAYGTPKPIDVACPVDLNADIDKMTPEEREIHALKLQQYALAKGIQL